MNRVVEGARAIGVRPTAVDREQDARARGFRVDVCEAASVGDGAWRGRIAAGCAADFAIVDTDVFAAEPAALLRARIVETVVAGTRRHG